MSSARSPSTKRSIEATMQSFDPDLVAAASRPGPNDDEIHRLMAAVGVT